MRGAPNARARARACTGIIPACAGSTHIAKPDDMRIGDHPRMCGEHFRSEPAHPLRRGSSPHVRGALDDGSDREQISGIIPACAGSTPNSHRNPRTAWDHPHMCGEHRDAPIYMQSTAGSSPHVRGALDEKPFFDSRRGIIPACAGSTTRWRMRPSQKRDHPRMCGEHQVMDDYGTMVVGSSPHVRGALRIQGTRPDCKGIIPACAGSTR